MTMRAQWQKLWQSLGVQNADNNLYDRLMACYSEPHRHYHTLRHLRECFAHLETLRELAQRPAEVELALWFHDAIYETGRKGNEAKSAGWARDSTLVAGLANDSAARIFDLIMVTRHDATPATTDAKVLVDIDLGILGAKSERFGEYERQIRAEYKWVPAMLYRKRRRQLSQGFINRPFIYSTEPFWDLYKARRGIIWGGCR